MMEVLAGVLAGSAFGGKVGNQYLDDDRPQDVGHMVIALRPDLAITAEDYRRRMAALVARAKACPTAEAGGEILMPGEPEARLETQRLRDGVPISAEDAAGLCAEARRAGVALPAALADVA